MNNLTQVAKTLYKPDKYITRLFLIILFCTLSVAGLYAQDYDESEPYEAEEDFNRRNEITDENRGMLYDENTHTRFRKQRKSTGDDAPGIQGGYLQLSDPFSNKKEEQQQILEPGVKEDWHNPDKATRETDADEPIYHDPPEPPDPPDLPISTFLSNLMLIVVLSITGIIALRHNRPGK